MADAQTVERAEANGLTLAYETFGSREDPPLLLIMGLATQMLGWHEEFCEALAGEGFWVVRFDNRDIGLSTHLDDAPVPDLGAMFAGDTSSATYTLDDMAEDTVGLLDALGLDSAHLVGASMGGMIGQMVAARHPERVRSLTSIMSTSGDPEAAQPTEAALGVLIAPPPQTREEAMDFAVKAFKVIGSPGFDIDEEWVRKRVGMSWDRSHDPAGVARQLAAIYASGDRTPSLADVRAPTLVIHGADDPLIPVGGGRATQAAIKGSEIVEYEGMGHDLPRDLWPKIVEKIAAHVRAADRSDSVAAE